MQKNERNGRVGSVEFIYDESLNKLGKCVALSQYRSRFI